MKRLILATVLSAGLAGCSNSASELHFSALPPELKDCKIFAVNNDSGSHIKVARCPNSTTTTTYSQGKRRASVIVVDGVEYERKAR